MEIIDQHFWCINLASVDIQQVLGSFTKILWNHFCYAAWLWLLFTVLQLDFFSFIWLSALIAHLVEGSTRTGLSLGLIPARRPFAARFPKSRPSFFSQILNGYIYSSFDSSR